MANGTVMQQLTLPDTRALESPRVLMESALTWIAENPDAWHWFVNAARLEADTYERVSVKGLMEGLRRHRIPYATASVKLPNSYSAAFSRILRAWHGHETIRGNVTLADCIPVSRSKLDGVSVAPRPY